MQFVFFFPLSFQLSVINYQLSVISYQLSVISISSFSKRQENPNFLFLSPIQGEIWYLISYSSLFIMLSRVLSRGYIIYSTYRCLWGIYLAGKIPGVQEFYYSPLAYLMSLSMLYLYFWRVFIKLRFTHISMLSEILPLFGIEV